jgi:hypothetical protein
MCPAMENSEDMDTSRVFEERLYGDICCGTNKSIVYDKNAHDTYLPVRVQHHRVSNPC